MLGTLPKAARPSRNLYFVVHTWSGTYADVAVNINGAIVLIGTRPPFIDEFFFVSLEGITYKRGGKVNGVGVNTTNWTPFACCGARSPGWYADKSGIIHLQGAARQIGTSGKANLLGTLPKAARPSRNLYFIVHTWSGTYADLAVNANGSIVLIGARSPEITDYTFVSLEGITYKRK